MTIIQTRQALHCASINEQVSYAYRIDIDIDAGQEFFTAHVQHNYLVVSALL